MAGTARKSTSTQKNASAQDAQAAQAAEQEQSAGTTPNWAGPEHQDAYDRRVAAEREAAQAVDEETPSSETAR